MARPKGHSLKRSESKCPIFGASMGLVNNVLTTYGDLMRACHWERNVRKTTKKEPLWSDIRRMIVLHLEDIWRSASIPIISNQRIHAILDSYYNKFCKLIKHYKERKDVISYRNKITSFKLNSNKLFDIAACKCKDKKCSCILLK